MSFPYSILVAAIVGVVNTIQAMHLTKSENESILVHKIQNENRID